MPLFCSHCGSENSTEATKCKVCEATVGHVSGAETTVDAGDAETSKLPAFNVVMAVVCVIYLINPTLGVFEFIPDNIPIIGNLDEAAATAGLWVALSNLGLNPFNKSK